MKHQRSVEDNRIDASTERCTLDCCTDLLSFY